MTAQSQSTTATNAVKNNDWSSHHLQSQWGTTTDSITVYQQQLIRSKRWLTESPTSSTDAVKNDDWHSHSISTTTNTFKNDDWYSHNVPLPLTQSRTM